jgi:hypothetical protein
MKIQASIVLWVWSVGCLWSNLQGVSWAGVSSLPLESVIQRLATQIDRHQIQWEFVKLPSNTEEQCTTRLTASIVQLVHGVDPQVTDEKIVTPRWARVPAYQAFGCSRFPASRFNEYSLLKKLVEWSDELKESATTVELRWGARLERRQPGLLQNRLEHPYNPYPTE